MRRWEAESWVLGEGPRESRILLVGQSPGREEMARRRPFVGPSGRLLDECLQEAGIDRSCVRIENVFPYPVPLPGPTPAQVRAVSPRIRRIVSLLPNVVVVVCLGNDSLLAVTGRAGVAQKRGEELEVVVGGRKVVVIPTFHPAYVLRRRSTRHLLVRDLVRAKRVADGRTPPPPAVSVVFQDSYPPGLGSGRPLFLDVELGQDDRPRLVGLGEGPDVVYVVPASSVPRDLRAWQVVGHNLKADLVWLKRYGVNVRGVASPEDTMLMAHLLDENRPLSLKSLAIELLDVSQYWRAVVPLIRRASTRGAVSYEDLGRYCANDVAATAMVYERLRGQIESRPNLNRVYRYISVPLMEALVDTEVNGVRFDTDRAASLVASMKEEASRIACELGPHVNWNSPSQVANFLYRELGLEAPETTEKGNPSTGVSALQKLRGLHPAVDLLLRYRYITKRVGMVEGWIRRSSGGRLYPSFNIAGTVTGRLSGSDPNPQNIPTDRDIRSLFVADPGCAVLAADYSMIELIVAAYVFGEHTILDAYNRGEDLHTMTAEAVLGRRVVDGEERKKYGKTPNFALLYGQGVDGFIRYAQKVGLSLDRVEACRIYDRWHELYPNIRKGWRRVLDEARENGGVVRSPSGRERRIFEVEEDWHQVVNFPVQATATELTHVAAILASKVRGWRILLHVHDSLVLSVPRDSVVEAARELVHIMSCGVREYFASYLRVELPFVPGVKVWAGPTWGDLTEVQYTC